MMAYVTSGMVQGVDGELVTVQTDISDGLPVFHMIGSLSNEVKEAKERVRTALKNTGFRLPPRRISVNLSPADIRKTGTFFDLPIAVALFVAMGLLPTGVVEEVLFLGELALDGTLLPLPGVLPILKKALDRDYHVCIVPVKNFKEASLLDGMEAKGFSSLKEVFAYLKNKNQKEEGTVQRGETEKDSLSPVEETLEKGKETGPDFQDVKGQILAKRALEIAVAGYHNLFLDGPPGTGKSMLAACVPGIMPEMTMEEKIETTMIYSVRGLLKDGFYLVDSRPCRMPTPAATMTGMFGGGINLKPGEVSLAHNGVLFLDEFLEYKKEMIEMFRIPLERHQITQIRNNRSLTFPADFLFIVAANSCPCGYYPDRQRCRCSISEIRKYQNKLSGPILDRMDLFVRCEAVPYHVLTGDREEEPSETVRKRVQKAWNRQRERFPGGKLCFNGRMSAKDTVEFCCIDQDGDRVMKKAFETFRMSGRAYYRVLRVARTIADLEGEEKIREEHLREALMFRNASLGIRTQI